MPRKKALIIGINYYGTRHQLRGCINDALNVRDFLVRDRGFPYHSADMVIMTDARENWGTPYWPSAANMMAAFQWLATYNQPGDVVWLSYSGHGAQARDAYGDRSSGFVDTICPVDFQESGMIDSGTLHRAIVSPMHPQARLTILFDCCHSGSACELPFVFRPEADGSINLVDTVQKGLGLVRAAEQLMRGGIDGSKIADAKMLLGGATDFFSSLRHRRTGAADGQGLAPEDFDTPWEAEGKDVWMFSGCADDETSADTSIAGAPTGAMSWAFIGAMRQNPYQSYLEILQNTRHHLLRRYAQIPQLSTGGHYDLSQPVYL